MRNPDVRVAAVRTGARFSFSLLAFVLLGAAAVRAHELGTLRTTVTFETGGAWTAEIIVDREHVPPGFGAGGRLPTRYGPIAGLPKELALEAGPVLATVAADAQAFFDGRPARVDLVALGPSNGGASEWRLRLSGRIPAGARNFAWSNRAPLGSYLLTLRTEGESVPRRIWLDGGETSAPVPLPAAVIPPAVGDVLRRGVRLGFATMLPDGAPEILFLVGMLMLSWKRGAVLLQVAVFTIAQMTALALASAGAISPPASAVATVLALSVVYVAVENVFLSGVPPWRIPLVFLFGLVHGMNLAGRFAGAGIPRSQFPPSILSFAAGVELGQLAVILAAWVLLGQPFRNEPWYRRRVVIPASVAIAAVGAMWAVQRILGAG